MRTRLGLIEPKRRIRHNDRGALAEGANYAAGHHRGSERFWSWPNVES